MRQAVSYIRVSTERQDKSGLGIDAQGAAIARFMEAEGCTALAEFVEVARAPMRWIAAHKSLLPWQPHARARQRYWWRSWIVSPATWLSSLG